MADIRKMTDDLAVIQKLGDEPNDVGGLTAANLKAKFDEAALAIQTYINETLIPDIKGLGYIGSAQIVVTAPADGWVQSSDGTWYQRVTASIVNVKDPVVLVSLYMDGSDTDEAMAKEYYGNVLRAEQSAAAITLWMRRKPEVDLKLNVAIA